MVSDSSTPIADVVIEQESSAGGGPSDAGPGRSPETAPAPADGGTAGRPVYRPVMPGAKSGDRVGPEAPFGYTTRGTPRQFKTLQPPGRQCTANIHLRGKPPGTTLRRCARTAIAGGFVCPKHGGQFSNVKAKAKERLADLVDPDRALRKLTQAVYAELPDFFDREGTIKPMSQWPKDMRGAVVSVRLGKDGKPINLKLVSQMRALEALMRYLGMWQEKVEVTGDADIIAALESGRTFAQDFLAGRRRLAGGETFDHPAQVAGKEPARLRSGTTADADLGSARPGHAEE